MDKYLILHFKNARLYRKKHATDNKRTKDAYYSYYENKIKRRKDLEPFVEDITFYQITNMLHVLFNERPVPTFRRVFYKHNQTINNCAINSYIKITTPKFYNKHRKYDDYYYEIINTKKPLYNSFRKNFILNWNIIKNYINDNNKFDKFIKLLETKLNIKPLDLPFNDIINLIQKLNDEDRFNLYDEIKMLGTYSGLIYVFGRYKKGVFIESDLSIIGCKLNCSALTNVNGVEKYATLKGEIIVPVTDMLIEKLKQSTGVATILDGGMVWIDSIKNGNEISTHEFTKVSDLSTEKLIHNES